MKTAIILISEAGLDTGKIIEKELKNSKLYSSRKIEGVEQIDSIAQFLSEHFNTEDAIVFIGAMGICVRSIAPFVKDKHCDPAIICIDSASKHVISVLSGHIGGANELTLAIAGMIGAEPVITTQSDLTGIWALDTLDAKFGWTVKLQNLTSMNDAIFPFVNKERVALLLEIRDKGTNWLETHLPEHVTLFSKVEDIPQDEFKLIVAVSPFMHNEVKIPCLNFVPKAIHIGVGLAHMAEPKAEIIQNIKDTLLQNGIYWESVASVSTHEEKRPEPVIQELEKELPCYFYSSEELKDIEVPTPSDTVAKHMGTASVSEASALLTANNFHFVMTKQKGSNYTVAAVMDRIVERSGHIEIVGAGPGDPELISVRGKRMLEIADLILYAGSLVPRELTYYAKPGATVRSSADLNLEEQIELMKRFYDEGKFVVRLHTGDPCIYGAIQEQMNWFDQYHMSYHITPGISSFQAAAAELKSQFTIPEKVQSIILTRGEGRTPMPDKEKLHLMARSQSTMCIFLSAGIAQQVQDELLMEYPPHTPVAACFHLTWPDQKIYRGELKDLAKIVEENNLTLTTMIVVGEAIDNRKGLSRLYADEFKHLFRK